MKQEPAVLFSLCPSYFWRQLARHVTGPPRWQTGDYTWVTASKTWTENDEHGKSFLCNVGIYLPDLTVAYVRRPSL
jgi:hypothetical protein